VNEDLCKSQKKILVERRLSSDKRSKRVTNFLTTVNNSAYTLYYSE